MNEINLLNKLRWRCRRGTKELDIILTRYLENDYLAATVAERQAFEALLEQSDDILLRYFLGEADKPALNQRR